MTRRFEPLAVLSCPLAGIRQIEASAGTGKTWSLCGLYARLVLERGLRVQEILVVTFTNAATAELRERIRARLGDVLAVLQGRGTGDTFVEDLLASLRAQGRDDAELGARLDLALASFDEAAIFTIHGFCQRALADASFTARAPLALELAPDDSRWAREAAADFWRRHVASEAIEPALAGALVSTKASPEKFAGLLRRRLARPLACERWPDGFDAAAAPDTSTLLRAHAEAIATWARRRDDILRVVEQALAGDHLKRNVYRPDSLADAAAAWDELALQPDGVAALARQGGSDDAKRFAKFDLFSARKLADNTKVKRTTPRDPFFERAQALVDARRGLEAPLELRRLSLIRSLLDEGERDVRASKRRERVVGFDDLLSLLHERLLAPQGHDLAQALATRFPAALIDEFQDTDPLQLEIFRRLYVGRPGPLFLIGDPKQAIYSFRNADLHTYLAAADVAQSHESLVENQRSTPELIQALNTLFCENPRAFMLDGLAYQPVAAGRKPRRPLRDDTREGAGDAPLQVWTLPADAGAGQPLACRDAERMAIDATAAEIARLLAAAQANRIALGRPGASPGAAGERPLAASDIAVLVRTNAQGSRVRQALHRLGVGSVELAQESIYASGDAEEIDRVLTAVLEPARERALKAALSTQAMGFDAAGIDALARDEIALAGQVQRFAAWRDAWQARGVAYMLRRWMSDAGVAGRLLARPDDGERRLTNLLHLIERLHEASADHEQPRALLRWLQAQRMDSDGPTPDESAQLRLESDRHLVQIVTVHKSKGLEYPLVFCPLLWTPARARPQDVEGLVYHDDEHRLVVDFRDALLDAADKEAIKRRIRLEAAAEEVRLLYVALTRAAHRCVLVAGCALQGGGKSPSATATARSPLNWLVAGADTAPADWAARELGTAAILEAWRALAARAGGTIALSPLPSTPGRPLLARPLPPERLVALAPPRPLPRAQRIGSFSGLAHGAALEDAARERDAVGTLAAGRAIEDDDVAALAAEAAVPGAVAGAVAFTVDADDILRFPRGPAAGECIHDVFERIDFTDAGGWPAAILASLRTWRTLRSVGAGGAEPSGVVAGGMASADTTRHAAMLRRMAADVLATPLPVGTKTPLLLETLPPGRRLVELEFHLGVERLDARSLRALLARAGIAVPPLVFPTLRGWLKGFIDLVFEHEGRWFVLDWKSNHLGDTPAAYEHAALEQVMHAQAYHLQGLLYLLALDRLLRARLPGYEPARHLGGAVYLFVRGVRPSWRDAQGRPTGMLLHHPGVDTLRRLSMLIEGLDEDEKAIA